MCMEHLLCARHREAPKHNSDLDPSLKVPCEGRPARRVLLCSVATVDTGKRVMGSSVKEDFLEVAS